MDITIKYRDKAEKWQDFDLETINHLSRSHAISLFSGKVPVICKEDGTYIVNTLDLMNHYKAKKQKVAMFESLMLSDESLKHVGFL